MTILSTRELVAAHALRTATRSGVPCAPIRDLIGSDQVDVAYAVQQHLVAERIAEGARVVGRKIGLTSPAVQAQLGVDRPDFGVLFDDMDVSNGTAPMSRLLQPKAEAELAFVLSTDLDGLLDLDRVKAAIGRTHVALEIVDSRIRDWDISFADTVADNASSGLFALGSQLPHYTDPALITMAMSRNGEVVSTGKGADCLGNPLNALLWLAETARDLGDPLRAGQIILSGALGPMAPVTAGDHIEAAISLGGLPMGQIAVRFTEGADQ
jgi:2-keto-4-pentenoate hydratase